MYIVLQEIHNNTLLSFHGSLYALNEPQTIIAILITYFELIRHCVCSLLWVYCFNYTDMWPYANYGKLKTLSLIPRLIKSPPPGYISPSWINMILFHPRLHVFMGKQIYTAISPRGLQIIISSFKGILMGVKWAWKSKAKISIFYSIRLLSILYYYSRMLKTYFWFCH
jgi:hypothetical protein